MTKDKAYDLLDKAISEIADDYWDAGTDDITLIKDIGYILGFADGLSKGLDEENNQ